MSRVCSTQLLNSYNFTPICVQFSVATKNGTAKLYKDFKDNFASLKNMTFRPGDSIELTISLVDDNVTEEEERFFVVFSSNDPDVIFVNDTATIFIIDNDGKVVNLRVQ